MWLYAKLILYKLIRLIVICVEKIMNFVNSSLAGQRTLNTRTF